MSSARHTAWSLTINNPTAADREALNLALQRGWKVEGQQETGESGTVHYQCCLRTPQCRFSAVKKLFPRAHIEPAKNVSALLQYVSKEDTRTGSLPVQSDLYPSLSKFWDLVFSYLDDQALSPYDGPIDEKSALKLLDQASYHLILNGYHVETLAVNPQTRSAFSKFLTALWIRSKHSQTARQTDTALESSEVSVPTIHNHAFDSDRPQVLYPEEEVLSPPQSSDASPPVDPRSSSA